MVSSSEFLQWPCSPITKIWLELIHTRQRCAIAVVCGMLCAAQYWSELTLTHLASSHPQCSNCLGIVSESSLRVGTATQANGWARCWCPNRDFRQARGVGKSWQHASGSKVRTTADDTGVFPGCPNEWQWHARPVSMIEAAR